MIHDDFSIHPDAVCRICLILRDHIFFLLCKLRLVDELAGYEHLVVLDVVDAGL